ncbi:hypothetical protein [Agrobacterium rubi]|uniref:2-phosphoglycerate kinase n=1 Tax=Agrobacterium rubi TaxID=28099 RepID=A0AAE7QYZ4_9HYPH|nr:hypothetical protein [Agrobacterium rubi]NTE86583.1 hypothetical protein [Agrobacterium rubi]NTF02515.1 hypothetical protein [Agrobacterium rubi]NTF36760.1 hypothetical protein [Agrobacterium rubi]OCJ55621.1 hypothetical protein A6U92_03290 [Agrobacterium rubi]QTF99209.1 hypothetical protein G6M88_01785 [Agrobacterium rubi]
MAAKIVLIGGTSHAGKSTLAADIAMRLGWRCLSTDSLARHPGRPWQTAPHVVPPHVVEHYRDLELNALMQSVLRHYDSMWDVHILPLIERETELVMEGSALLPDTVAPLLCDHVRAVWLVASDAVIEHRMKAESDYALRDDDGRLLIDKFLSRALAFNRFIADEVARLKLVKIDIDLDGDGDDLSLRVLEWLRISD